MKALRNLKRVREIFYTTMRECAHANGTILGLEASYFHYTMFDPGDEVRVIVELIKRNKRKNREPGKQRAAAGA